MAEKIKQYELVEEQVVEDSVLHKAWDPLFQRHVTIKEPLPHLLKNRSFLDRFVEAGKRLANINNPNLAKVYDLIPPGEIDDKCYLVMEYGGQRLEDIAKSSPLSVAQGKAILKDVLNGLRAVHDTGLVHGNVRPSSILIAQDGSAKLADLRIAAVGDADSTVPIGSPRYLPHEVIQEDGKIGPWSDLYSLGCVGYEMLAGARLFDGQFAGVNDGKLDERETLDPRYRRWHCDPALKAKSLAQLDEKIPQALSDIVARLVEKNIAQRYQSADEVLRDLDSGPKSESKTSVIDDKTRPLGEKPTMVQQETGKTRVIPDNDQATKPITVKKEQKSTIWRDALIILAVTILGLAITVMIIKLS